MHLGIKSDAFNYMETQFFLKDFYTWLCVNPQEPADRHTKQFTCASGAEVLELRLCAASAERRTLATEYRCLNTLL